MPRCAQPPGERVADEVDVLVFFRPEVDIGAEDWPVPWMRVVCVAAAQAGIGPPRYVMEFPSFTEEAWQFVVRLFGVDGNCVNGQYGG